MDKDNKDAYGRIERILNMDYLNGQIVQTRFEMKIFDTRLGRWSDRTEYCDFYGPIPPEYVGMEARYLTHHTAIDDVVRETADVTVGKITNRNSGPARIYEITKVQPNPAVPATITSQLLKRIKGEIVFPYEHLHPTAIEDRSRS
ncbi:hypothetical protein KY362_07745 [Candidatus Woesearchaeota archaeon]|nr:hypothetical protein [Candidatus Woesearchaeota archaeon]